MSRLFTAALAICFVLGSWQSAQAKEPLDKKYPNGLPRYMTEEEKLMPLVGPTLDDFINRTPPAGSVYCPAEYEHNDGIFFSWKSHTNLLTTMTVNITTLTNATVYMVVDSSSEQSSASSALNSAGADMGQVDFIIRATDAVWIRDYGPRFIFEDGYKAIIDHTYNRPSRPNDNALNDHIAALWGVSEYDIPLTHGGGNFHLFSNGDAFMTSLITEENPGVSEQDVIDLYAEYQNLNLTIYDGFPFAFDGTKHIDMWMLPIGDYKVIIGRYEPSDGTPYTITENTVADLESRGYTVYRTPGWNSGGTHYTYTNAVIINGLVFISAFNGYTTQNDEALAVFEDALPDYTVIPLNSSSIITQAGAMHCISMHVPGRLPSMLVSPSSGFEPSGPAGGPFTPSGIVYTLENTTGTLLDYEVTSTQDWLTITNDTGTISTHDTVDVTVSINSVADALGSAVYEDTINIRNLTDHEGNTNREVVLRVGVPEAAYSWDMSTDPGWTTEGLWAWGQPQGLGGEHGGPDPTSGYTGSNVYGYNLNGDYLSDINEEHLTSGPLDCTYLADVHLKFQRWLGVEQPLYDHAYIRVSTDGANWTDVWHNTSPVSDFDWVEIDLDIAQYADGEPVLYLRWTMGDSDDSWQYCGWNIDDVEIWALDSSVEDCPYDLDGNGFVGGGDINLVKANYGPVTPESEAYDLDNNGFVGGGDINLIKANYGPCP